MAMPKTSMHEDGHFPPREHHVRPPGEPHRVPRKPEASVMQRPANECFWTSVSAAYPGHHLASDFRIHYVRHVFSRRGGLELIRRPRLSER